MSADTPQRSMPRPALPEFRTDRAAATRNGLPEPQPYRYRGAGRSLTPQQAARRLHVLDAGEAVDGPGAERRREAAQEVTGLAILPPAPRPAPSLATSREARAAVPVPQVIRLRPVQEPFSADGRRRAWVRPMPASLAARIAALSAPPPDEWCGRCGYKLARCCCPGGPRGGES